MSMKGSHMADLRRVNLAGYSLTVDEQCCTRLQPQRHGRSNIDTVEYTRHLMQSD
jgi:hypothetical protein